MGTQEPLQQHDKNAGVACNGLAYHLGPGVAKQYSFFHGIEARVDHCPSKLPPLGLKTDNKCSYSAMPFSRTLNN